MILKINGTEIPSPSVFEIGYYDLSKTETNAAGNVIMDVLGHKRSLNVAWSFLMKDRCNDIISAVRAAPFMQITFFDPNGASEQTGTFYVDQISAPAYRYVGNTPISYKNVKIVFKER